VPRFTNWARTVVTRPAEHHAPSTAAEISQLLVAARGHKVRVVGAAHSWSAINAPEDLWVTLDGLTGVTIDRAHSEATVLGGTRLHDLLTALAAEGFTLPIVGSITAQSIAGAIATGTHGSSLVHGNLASLVTKLELATSDGVVELTGERLAGARVHLGALGVVTSVTLRIEPLFQLAEHVEDIAISEVASALPAIATSAEYVKLWWMPHAPTAQVFRYTRTTEATAGRPERKRWIDERVMHRFVFPLVVRAVHLPGMIRPISRVIARSFVGERRVGPATLMLQTPMPLRHRETEGALPLAKAGEAFDRLARAIADDRALRINFPMELRFVPNDPAWLSPAHGADTCQIGAYCHGRSADRYFAMFWRELRAMNARPHWGKELDHTAEEVRALWPELGKFHALRDELDPERMFGSAFHARTLGA
jgi:FAD/FMN-containing dehydrogenase